MNDNHHHNSEESSVISTIANIAKAGLITAGITAIPAAYAIKKAFYSNKDIEKQE
jgi:hypothetical protein